MKRVLLASAACLALSLPAMAANTRNQPNPPPKSQATAQSPQPANPKQNQAATQPSPPANQQQSQANQPPQPANQQQAQVIQPSTLSKEQIREIQMKLDQAGFKAKRVDGMWGPETKDALMSFQKAKNLPGSGELNQQTLANLGVNMNTQGQATGVMSKQSATTGAMSNQSAKGQARLQTKPGSVRTNAKTQSGTKAKTP